MHMSKQEETNVKHTMLCTSRKPGNIRYISHPTFLTKKKAQTYVILSMHNLCYKETVKSL